MQSSEPAPTPIWRRALASRDWRFALARVLLFSALGWLLLRPWLPEVAVAIAGSREEQWPRTDFAHSAVPLDELEPGGPPRDGIPPIDHPRFAPATDIDWLAADAPVIAVQGEHSARAYPLEILIWHEIVNDTLEGRPLAGTFCPLCNAALVFDRRVDGEVLDFGTTGWLRMSDLLMYDRQSESWWQQFTGSALIGARRGQQLRQIPAQIIGFADFRAAWPRGDVLTRQTGHRRPYGKNPYAGYDSMRANPLQPARDDPRLAPMQRLLAVQVGAHTRAYAFADIDRHSPIHDRLGDTPIVILARRKGMRSALDSERIARGKRLPAAAAFIARAAGQDLHFQRDGDAWIDTETGSRWNLLGHAIAGPLQGQRLQALPGGIHFAFAWFAFRPEVEVWRAP